MEKKTSIIIVCVGAVLILGLFVGGVIGSISIHKNNASLIELQNEINILDDKLKMINEPSDYPYELEKQIEELEIKISEIQDYQNNNDKDKIILNYQDAQERFERRINIFLIMVAALSIAIPIFSRSELNRIQKQTKKFRKELKNIYKKTTTSENILKVNNQMKLVDYSYQKYNKDRNNMMALEGLVNEIAELLNNDFLDDFERTRYLQYIAWDLHKLERNDEAEERYSDACRYANKTKEATVIAEAYEKQAIYFSRVSKYDQAISSIKKSISVLPDNLTYRIFIIDMYIKLVKERNTLTSSDKNKIIEAIISNLDDIFTINEEAIKKTGCSSIDFETQKDKIIEYANYLYKELNNSYSDENKKHVKWICEKLDSLNQNNSDVRLGEKINNDYHDIFDKEIIDKYLALGYAEKTVQKSV